MEMTIKDIMELLYKYLRLMASLIISGLLIFFIICKYMILPSYTASVQLYVNESENSISDDINELYYAQKIVTTYINFLRTKVFYNEVLKETGLNYTLKQLEKMTDIQSVNNTEIFQISVTTKSASDSYQFVLVMQKVAPELIKSIKSSTEISIVDPVEFPTEPSGPNVILYMAVGGMSGFIITFVIAFFREMINAEVKNQEELATRYHKPILGIIPDYGEKKKKKHKIWDKIPYINKYRKHVRNEIKNPIYQRDKFAVKEAFKSLRINLLFTIPKHGCKKILINSPMPEEGKSSTCVNMGISIAQTGAKVLLIDCDLRKGRLHNYLNIKNTDGLSNILSGMREEDVIKPCFYPNLFVLTMGTLPPNPTEILASVRMEELLNRLEINYDYILVDTPPVNIVSDALSLIKLVDGVLIIVMENKTSHTNIIRLLGKYELAEANILGFVINRYHFRKRDKMNSKYYSMRKE